MKLIDKIVAMQDEFIKIRHQIHANPELGFSEFETSKLVANKLREYGYMVHENIGKSGVVGVLKKGDSNKSIGLRADMDALPLQEKTNLDYKSKNVNIMHACGHDGHTTSLLLAAKYLSNESFNGTLNLYFQPAEEGLGGAKAMIEDGLLKQFDSDFIFGWHNMPFKSNKKFFIKNGAMMASCDNYTISINGVGSHGSTPHKSKDVIYIGSMLIASLQSIVSRNINPQDSIVISIGAFNSGAAFNIIPDTATIKLSLRALDKNARELADERIRAIIKGMAISYEVEIEIKKDEVATITMNDAKATEMAKEVAVEIFGEENCEFNHAPLMASEDFGYFCEERKCAYAFLENENDIFLHSPYYVFNDELLPRAASYYARLVQKYLG